MRGTHGHRRTKHVVVVNVYLSGIWDRLEMYHPDCYETAGKPYGEPHPADPKPSGIIHKRPRSEPVPLRELLPLATRHPEPASDPPEQPERPSAKEEPMAEPGVIEKPKLRGWIVQRQQHVLASETIDETDIRNRVLDESFEPEGVIVIVLDDLHVTRARVDFHNNHRAENTTPRRRTAKRRVRRKNKLTTSKSAKQTASKGDLPCRQGCGRSFTYDGFRIRHEATCTGGHSS
jgi:hypothetical protein